MADELRKFIAPEFIFGVGAIDLVGQYAGNFGGKRILVVSDPGVAEAGWTQRVKDSLDSQALESVEYLEVSPNPKDTQVHQGAQVYLEQDCDVIVAVGGGSPMDCAKAIGIVVTNDGPIADFEGADQIEVPIPPLICIPTTAGTSADVSQFAIISDTQRALKMAIVSKVIVPDVALIDPSTLLTMPRELTMATGMDALVHAMEAFVSNAASPFTDLHALEAVRLIHENLPRVLQYPQDMEGRTLMMRGSLEAGLAFSNASLGAIHAMAHALGGRLDLPHGECNARLLGAVVRANYPFAPGRYGKIFEALQLPGGSRPLEEFEDYLGRLMALGNLEPAWDRALVSDEVIDQLAGNALADACMVTNPRKLTKEDVRALYGEVFR